MITLPFRGFRRVVDGWFGMGQTYRIFGIDVAEEAISLADCCVCEKEVGNV